MDIIRRLFFPHLADDRIVESDAASFYQEKSR